MENSYDVFSKGTYGIYFLSVQKHPIYCTNEKRMEYQKPNNWYKIRLDGMIACKRSEKSEFTTKVENSNPKLTRLARFIHC